MKRAVLYIRVSSEAQAAEEKASVPTQLADCRRYAQERGFTILAEYIDAERYRVGKRLVEPSATRADRPAFLQLIEHAKRERTLTVIAWREDRLYRSIRSAALIDDLLDTTHTTIELVMQKFDRDMLGFRAAIGRYELQAIKQRVNAGIQQRVAHGLPRNRPPSAYTRQHDPSTGAFLRYVFDEKHRGFFDELARLFLDHTPYHAMATTLGRHPVTGARLSATNIRRIMLDPFYRGLIAVNGRKNNYTHADALHPGQHQPVWDADTCRDIAHEIERRARIGRSAPRDPAAMFTGVLFCGFCGRAMGSFVITKPGRPPARAYRCRQPDLVRYGQTDGPAHPANNIRETKLKRLVTELIADDNLEEMIAEYTEKLAAVVPINPQWRTDQRTGLLSQIIELEHDLDNITSPTARAALENEKERLETQAALLEPRLPAAPVADPAKLRAGIQRLRTMRLWELSPDAIRRHLTTEIPAIYVTKGEISIGAE